MIFLLITVGCNAKALITGRKNLPDDLIAASSSVDTEHSPARSRLNQPAQGPYAGAWVPLYQDLHQYIEVSPCLTGMLLLHGKNQYHIRYTSI